MVSKSYLPASAAGKGMTVVSGVVAAAACLTPAGIVCLFSPFCVCVPTQPGVSNPRSGPHGRRDAADWSQRVFSALPGVRLHHHASRWHVSETLCTQASVGAACRATQQSICTSKHWFTCPNKHGHSPVVSLALGPALACATIYLWHDCCPPDQYGKMQKKKKRSCPIVGESSWQLSKKRSKQIETAAHCALEQFLMQMSQWWRPFWTGLFKMHWISKGRINLPAV